MASHINQVILAGNLLTNPVEQEDGSVIATLQNHEEWRDAAGLPQSRENMLGIIALPGKMSRSLLNFRATDAVIVIGNLETRTTIGPRGGKETKTKVRLSAISRPV